MIEREKLLDSITRACTWLTDISQIQTERIPTECLHYSPMQKSWKGSFRGEYNAGKQQWGMFCPVWHSGQAAKALCMAYQLTGEKKWLDSAISAGDFLLNQQVTEETSPEFGLIYAIEDYPDCVNTSAILESMEGLLWLSEVTGDQKYTIAAHRAVSWVRDNAYMGDGHFRDNYSLTEHRFLLPEWMNYWEPPAGYPKREGRPLADDAIFLKMYKLTGEQSFRDVFYTIADHLRTHEVPAGTWNNYQPSDGLQGLSHPRQSFWWGMPMYDAYMDTGDIVYYNSLRRCGEWYLRAQRQDGSLFRSTDLAFNTPAFGLCSSGISCASLLWMRLYSVDRDEKWMEAVERALQFNMKVQFRNVSDGNLSGAILERTQFVAGSDASPYHLRDLGTIFFIQAAVRYIEMMYS